MRNHSLDYSPTSPKDAWKVALELSARRKAEMAHLRAIGWTFEEIAARYGVTYQRVMQILKNQPRGHNGYPSPAEPTPALGDPSV